MSHHARAYAMCELRCEAVLDNKADMLDNDAATKGQEAGIRGDSNLGF